MTLHLEWTATEEWPLPLPDSGELRELAKTAHAVPRWWHLLWRRWRRPHPFFYLEEAEAYRCELDTHRRRGVKTLPYSL